MWRFNRGKKQSSSGEGLTGLDYTLWRIDFLWPWYKSRAEAASNWHKITKLTTILLGALISVMSVRDPDPVLIAAFGAAIVAIQGIQELFQFQANWVKDATTKELLLREKALYLANAWPYGPLEDAGPERLLAERTEAVVAKELEAWVQGQKGQTGGGTGEGPGTTGTGTRTQSRSTKATPLDKP